MAKESVVITCNDLDNLPEVEAVYAIFAREKETLKPINCRYVGETDNLQRRTKEHCQEDEPNECLREFMQSTNTKILVYELMPGSTKEERLEAEAAWRREFKPICNK